MGGWIKHHVTVLQRNALEAEFGVVGPSHWIAETFGFGIEVELDGVIVGDAIFESFSDFPQIKILLSNGLVALGAQCDPLLELGASFGHGFGLISVSETP